MQTELTRPAGFRLNDRQLKIAGMEIFVDNTSQMTLANTELDATKELWNVPKVRRLISSSCEDTHTQHSALYPARGGFGTPVYPGRCDDGKGQGLRTGYGQTGLGGLSWRTRVTYCCDRYPLKQCLTSWAA